MINQKMNSIRALALKNVIKDDKNDQDWWESNEIRDTFSIDNHYDMELTKLLDNKYKR